MITPPSPEQGENPPPASLEHILRRHEDELTLLAQPGHPLKRERLATIAPHLLKVVDEAEANGIGWPDEESIVPIKSGAHLAEYVDVNPEEADRLFMLEVLAGITDQSKQRGFNNFPVILAMLPQRPREGESAESLRKNYSMRPYSTKPYLWRAHMLKPEFMEAVQKATAACNGPTGWGEAMVQGALEPEEYPYDAALLRASRLGYKLLANLIRSDDKKRQWEWLGLDPSTASEIDDPEAELWT